MVRPFEDHFALDSSLYARARPRYPTALTEWLAGQAPGRLLAWDAATGSGLLAHLLQPHFAQVYASDASPTQLAQAGPAPGVKFVVERAEQPSLDDGSVDLVTVAAGAHWLDLRAFYESVRRVAAPRAAIALFSYGVNVQGSPHLREALNAYSVSIEPHWTPSYQVVVGEYVDLPFPFERVEMPNFGAVSTGDLHQLLDLLRTWSGSLRAREATGEDPVAAFEEQICWAWNKEGPAEASRSLCWPIFGHVGRLP